MDKVYTLVHYRPDGSNYVRNCLMGSSHSDLEIASFTDIETAAKSIAEKRMINEASAREYAEWETTILIDGYSENDTPLWNTYDGEGDDPGVPYTNLELAARGALKGLQAEAELKKMNEQAVKAAEIEAKRVRDAEAAEARDKAEFVRLSEKYGAPPHWAE
jgi:hypothetical protein